MSSIIPDFEYDIFISYRQNDNKYDGWISEFVEKLQQELNATVKDKLSVYFDENPQDGLLETHQVGETLNEKLKTLIFIPIISQTYCDTESFAWQHEFLNFKSIADTNKFGMNVKLTNGNIASRILPVKIHDIDIEDVRLLEKELSGVIRSVDFIYREAGVNRPLRPKDDDLGNPNLILYRNQINKVANAIKEVISGIKAIERGDSPATSNINLTSEAPTAASGFSTSLPEEIKVTVIDKGRPNIFLSWTSADLKEQREELSIILQKAGFNVYPSVDCPADDQSFKDLVNQELNKCSGSLHMLSGEYGRRLEEDDETSFPKYQFEEAKKLSQAEGSEFQTFIWHTQEENRETKPAQQEFIKYIRNNVTKNMMFSNALGPMPMVDDIRVVLMKEVVKELDTKDTDIFFIFNQQDEQDAKLVTDLISNEYPVEVMNILPDGEEEYRQMSTQQIPKSKLAVVYFKYAADWALPFIKQVWKQIGGASTPTPLMLVGEDEPKSNAARTFKAPKVVSTIVSKGDIAKEVKKVYVQVIDLK